MDEKRILSLDSSLPFEWVDGRMGVVTSSDEFPGRLVLICPELEDESQFVVYIASSTTEGLIESFWGRENLEQVVEDLGIVWIAPGPLEEQVERQVFSIRDDFRS